MDFGAEDRNEFEPLRGVVLQFKERGEDLLSLRYRLEGEEEGEEHADSPTGHAELQAAEPMDLSRSIANLSEFIPNSGTQLSSVEEENSALEDTNASSSRPSSRTEPRPPQQAQAASSRPRTPQIETLVERPMTANTEKVVVFGSRNRIVRTPPTHG